MPHWSRVSVLRWPHRLAARFTTFEPQITGSYPLKLEYLHLSYSFVMSSAFGITVKIPYIEADMYRLPEPSRSLCDTAFRVHLLKVKSLSRAPKDERVHVHVCLGLPP